MGKMNDRRPGGGAENGRLPLKDGVRMGVRLLRCMAPWRGRLVRIVLVGLFSVGCDLVTPLLIAWCIDAMAPGGGLSLLSAFAKVIAVFAGVGILSAVVEYAQGYWSAELSADVEQLLRRSLFRKLTRLPVETVERMQQGDLMSRIYNDARLAASAFSQAAVSLLCGSLVILGCGTIMLWKSTELAAIVIVTSLLSLAVTCLASGGLLPRISEQQESLGVMNAHISESLTAFRSGVEGGRVPWDLHRMKEVNERYFVRRMKVCRLEGVVEPLLMLLGNGAFLLLATRGAVLAIEHRITLGTVQAFLLYFKLFMDPVNELGMCWVQMQNALSSAGRIFSILDREEEADAGLTKTGRQESEQRDVLLCFEQVGFGYHRNLPVLKNFDLCVHRGQHVAIVGKTGVGKTTLMNLLERFYQNYTGRILLEGRELREVSLEELRRRITLIPQEPQLTDGTILENLTYGTAGVTLEKISQAAEELGVADLIRALPLGYNTRITTIVRADLICVMEDGQIRETGSHGELMKRQGAYYELFMSQYWGKEI